jgi:glycosyltransferase involved in cell wall biosynthesis
LEAFKNQPKMPLVIVGNWNSSQFGKETKENYSGNPNLILMDAIYDRLKLDILRSNCTIYVHGHSAGGTNPSLCEAMYLALPVFAYASGYNENTTFDKAKYFKNENELSELVDNYESFDLAQMGKDLKEIAVKHYRWSQIAEEYKKVILNN